MKDIIVYKPGDYFGERCLLKDEQLSVDIIAKTNC